METLTIFHPTDRPYIGHSSKRSIVALPGGWYNKSINWRFDEGIPKVRFPMTRLGTDGGISATSDPCIGAWTGILNGARTIVAVYGGSSLEAFSIDPTTNVRTQLTNSSGKYGDTRFDGFYKMVSFAPVHDRRSGQEYLVIQDGTGYARVWNPLETDSGEKVAINQPITVPVSKAAFNAVVTFPKFVTLKDLSTWADVDTGGGQYAGSDGGSGTTLGYWIHTIDPTVNSSDYTTGTMAAVDYSGLPFMYFLVNTSYASWMDQIEITIGEGSASTVIWDASQSVTKYKYPLKIPLDATGTWFLYGVSISDIADASKNAIDTYKFRFVGTAPATAQTVNVYGIFGAGQIAGGALHALAYGNLGSRAESAGVFYDATDVVGESFKNLGVSNAVSKRVPNDPRVFYRYLVNFPNTTTAQQSAGVDCVHLYRSDVGEDQALRSYVATITLSTYSGGWTFSADSTSTAQAAQKIFTYYDDTPIGSKNDKIYAPDTNCLTIPKGIWQASTTERLFVAAYDTTGGYNTPSHSTLWASDVYNFSRFYPSHRDEEQGTSVNMSGETIIALQSMPTSVYGVSTMLMFTNDGLYRFSPTSATAINRLERISPYGTWCPYSVAASEDSVYWVDQLRIVRRYSGAGVEDISSESIQDKLDLVGGSTWAIAAQGNSKLFFGGVWKRKYYLSFDQTGTISWTTGKETPFVYDERGYGWVEDSLGHANLTTRFWLPVQSNLYTFSLGWASSASQGWMFKYEDAAQTTDGYQYATGGSAVAGNGYSATLKTGALFPGLQGDASNGLVVRWSDVLCDDFASGTAAFTYDYFPSRSEPTHSADIDQSFSTVWGTPGSPPSDVTEGKGVAAACQLVLSSGCAGVRLYGWRIRYEKQSYRPSAE